MARLVCSIKPSPRSCSTHKSRGAEESSLQNKILKGIGHKFCSQIVHILFIKVVGLPCKKRSGYVKIAKQPTKSGKPKAKYMHMQAYAAMDKLPLNLPLELQVINLLGLGRI